MAAKLPIHLSPAEESLLVPLYGRALDSLGKRPILSDPKAVEIAAAIDWDFQRFNQKRRIVGSALRSALFDAWAADFIRRHPQATVVEIGAGLNTRFERLDNGHVRWFDLDLPDVVELRRRFFADSDRRTTLAASVVDRGWIAAVRTSPRPYLFVAETVFIYLTEPEVKAALAQIAANFPGAMIAFDTASLEAISRENQDHARLKLAARGTWACEDPRDIERWNIGLRLVESRSLLDVPESVKARRSWRGRIAFRLFAKLFPKISRVYRLNLFAAGPA